MNARFFVGVVLGLSLVWAGLMLFGGVLMSTGFADEPGDTNGFRRFLFVTFVIGSPGWIGIVTSSMILRRMPKPQEVPGFPVLLGQQGNRWSDDDGSYVDFTALSASDAASNDDQP